MSAETERARCFSRTRERWSLELSPEESNPADHLKGIAVRVLQVRHMEGFYDGSELGLFSYDYPALARLRLFDVFFLVGCDTRLDRPEGRLQQGEHFFLFKVARDYYEGVGGDVIGLVMGLKVIEGVPDDVLHPPYDGPVVGLDYEGGGIKLLAQHGLRVVVSPHPPLFHDNGPLRLEVLLAEDEVFHPVRFER